MPLFLVTGLLFLKRCIKIFCDISDNANRASRLTERLRRRKAGQRRVAPHDNKLLAPPDFFQQPPQLRNCLFYCYLYQMLSILPQSFFR